MSLNCKSLRTVLYFIVNRQYIRLVTFKKSFIRKKAFEKGKLISYKFILINKIMMYIEFKIIK